MGSGAAWDQPGMQQILLEAVGQAVIATDVAGAVTYWNAAAVTLYGWPAHEVMGRLITELTVPRRGREHAAAVMQALREGTCYSGEFTAQRRDGTTFPALVVDRGIYAEGGELIGILGVSTDLSDLKKAEQAREDSDGRLRTVVANSPVVLLMFDAAGTVTLAEGHCLPPFLRASAGPVGTPMAVLTSRAPAVAQAVARCLAGDPADVTLALEGRHFDFRCRPNRGSDGTVTGALAVGTDVTARVEAAEQSAAGEARWRALILRSADAAVLADAGTTALTYVSPAATRLFGWQPQELIGRPGLSLVHPDDRDRIAGVLRALTEDPSEHPTVEFRLECADGSYRWVEETISNLADEPGVAGLVGNVRDITERRAAEDALGRRDRLTRALAARAADIALVVGLDGQVCYLNPSASAVLVAAEGDTLDFEGLPTVHPDDRPAVRDALSAVGAPGTSARVTYRSLAADGEWRWAEQVVSNWTDDADIGGFVVNIRDVTERVEAERALRASEARYRLIAETAQEGIWATDPAGGTLYANQKMADLLGRSLPEVYTLCGFDLAPAQNRADPARQTRNRRAIGTEQYELEYTTPDGSRRMLRISASPLVDDDDVHLGSLAMVTDVTEAREAERQLRYRALHDPLTGLPNRAALLERLQVALERTRSPAGALTSMTVPGSVAVLVADIDQFKLVNDSFGHAAGDDLLIELARRWRQVLRPQDTVARLGGDEFVVLCQVTGEDGARLIANRLLGALTEPVQLSGRAVTVSASIGIALTGRTPVDGSDAANDDADTVLRYADAAMYQAKAQGRSRTAMFNSRLVEQARARLELCNDLKAALEQGELRLHYQPVVELATGRLLGVEALCRWTHPERGNIAPDEFIRAAEESGLIQTLDRWVLRQACRDGAAMRAAGVLLPDAQIAVNVSAGHLSGAGYEAGVRAALTEAGLPARILVLEVTESAVMTDPDTAGMVLEGLQALGVEVAIDDFGTGYSSLAYLRRLPVATLKIDRSFIEHITDRCDDRAIVTAVIDLARALNVHTTAEGIETFAHLALLQQLGCRAGQGFLWSRALPPDELATLFRDLPQGRFPIHAPTPPNPRAEPLPLTGEVSAGDGVPTTVIA